MRYEARGTAKPGSKRECAALLTAVQASSQPASPAVAAPSSRAGDFTAASAAALAHPCTHPNPSAPPAVADPETRLIDVFDSTYMPGDSK